MSTTTTPTKLSADTLFELIKNRRSYYALSKDLPISKDRVQEIVQQAVLHTPSSFNSQSNRVVVLFGEHHDRLWEIVTETLKAIVPEDSWGATAGRLGAFKGGAASILFFEDQTVVQDFQNKFATYADKFPIWATQSDAMLQHNIWVALEAEGLGANLQHYNPIIDERVTAEWKVPSTWKLNAQLVIGGRAGGPNDKTFQPLEERYKVFGA